MTIIHTRKIKKIKYQKKKLERTTILEKNDKNKQNFNLENNNNKCEKRKL